MQRLFALPYSDRPRAMREIADLTRALPHAPRNRFDLLLSSSPAPEQGLHYFVRLREANPAAFDTLTRSTAGLRHVVAVFTHSRFLSEEILRHPDWAERLSQPGELQRHPSREALLDRLSGPGVPTAMELALFRREQLLRIVVRDALGLASLAETTADLSDLADAILETALARILDALAEVHGVPRAPDGTEVKFAVIALGKLGGKELNYSSDIDLMFVYSHAGETDGPSRITAHDFYRRAANQLTSLLSTYTTEGLCYRVDLRLRPDGSQGEVCMSLDGARSYYSGRARDWELQMMIKARAAAGHRPTAQALLDFVEPLTYATTLDFPAIERLSATRERLNEKLTARQTKWGIASKMRQRGSGIDVKLERGGIRDIEFLVQCLQRLHGGASSWVRHGGTMLALSRLHDRGYITAIEHGKLASAYLFFRHVEHRLQFDEDLQTHTLPGGGEELDLVARRMPTSLESGEALSRDLRGHFAAVTEIYERVVHGRAEAIPSEAPSSPQRGHWEHFQESAGPAVRERLTADEPLARHAADLFRHSPYFSEELIRTPALLDDIAHAERPLSEESPAPETLADLRQWYRREMVRIQADSVCNRRPIFETLDRTSRLAETVIARAYAAAVRETALANPPVGAGYVPGGQLWVVGLGRLGMMEFDLGSDADLVFVLAGEDAEELPFWTRVAERMVNSITAYTGGGTLFAVDTRLRPLGNDGDLVQTEAAFREYFSKTAQAWEGITYMKSRALAGDVASAERFLRGLQSTDWVRYGLEGRSRMDLREMRLRLEREQGSSHPLKAGVGGYYDIDFLLMYLRLKSAGMYFSVLNTPERIEVLSHHGQLGREEASFLLEAATFYRAVDHGIRVLSGHAEGNLPKSDAQRLALGELVARWSPVPLADLPEIRAKVRALFDRYFR